MARFLRALRSNLSSGQNFLSILNHECLIAIEADIRFFGSYSNNLLNKSQADSEIRSHSESSVEQSPTQIFSQISSQFYPQKGQYPTRRICIITPIDHISHFSLYLCLKTSGARQQGQLIQKNMQNLNSSLSRNHHLLFFS
eukprot:TRINITY_DN19209_c0_g1_i1.p1 TRINITY_DN19209_c0_g1~~TRINITY_DN19209_c0_g1_i1.p1  ORF type:complete len:141 (-),score=2.91 TRINITY_DN19209_c0_g1_i1:15-437(-)